jgi:hypothetical protein
VRTTSKQRSQPHLPTPLGGNRTCLSGRIVPKLAS